MTRSVAGASQDLARVLTGERFRRGLPDPTSGRRATAYDTDDIVYRVTTMVQIAGALVFAAGAKAKSR